MEGTGGRKGVEGGSGKNGMNGKNGKIGENGKSGGECLSVCVCVRFFCPFLSVYVCVGLRLSASVYLCSSLSFSVYCVSKPHLDI